jgi:hypothetical protein
LVFWNDQAQEEPGSGLGRRVKVSVAMSMVSLTKVVLPSVLASFAVSYAFWDLSRNRKIFGGTVPPSLQNEEWLKETLRKFDEGWPREASCPVVMNPISRQNYHKVM